MRVLDTGCGTALSSIFLAKRFGVEVRATDLWVKSHGTWDVLPRSACKAEFTRFTRGSCLPSSGDEGRGVHRVQLTTTGPVGADGFFDAAVSIDAYHYFGTDDLYPGYYSASSSAAARSASFSRVSRGVRDASPPGLESAGLTPTPFGVLTG
jgi:hypothetical protein